MTVSILAFAGSNRQDSWNWKLVRYAARLAQEAGARVTVAPPEALDLPLVNEDRIQAQGYPEAARRWKTLLANHDGFLIASPEYNGFFTPLLKNALDWASIPEDPREPSLQAFRGKVAALLAASPGSLGGLRGLLMLRIQLENLKVLVLPQQVSVPFADRAFDRHGNLTDPRRQQAVRQLVQDLVTLLRKLHA